VDNYQTASCLAVNAKQWFKIVHLLDMCKCISATAHYFVCYKTNW